MLADVELLFHPNIANCLAWSEDGELAIAAGEFIHILIPRRRQLERKQDRTVPDPWERVQFRVNTFTYDEWPGQDPASFDDFSIGEEQSACTVIALQWSLPGLGKHKRPVLAVLTSNLLLSFWSSTSDPINGASWQRVFIVNNAALKSWERRYLSGKPLTESLIRRKLRIRSTAWAPKARQCLENYDPQVEARQGVFLLAVANDDAEVLILLISSPYIDHSNSWDAKIVKIIRFSDNGPQTDCNAVRARAVFRNGDLEVVDSPRVIRDLAESHSSVFKIALKSKQFIDSIAWGPLALKAKGETVLSFIRNGVVFHCSFSISFLFPEDTFLFNVPRFRFKCSDGYKKTDIDQFGGVVAWHSHSPNDEPFVVVGDRSHLNMLSKVGSSLEMLPFKGGPYQMRPTVDRLGGCEARKFSSKSQSWDQISGLAFYTNPEDQSVSIYLSKHLSHVESIRVVNHTQTSSKRRLSWEILPQPPLYKHMQQIRSQFDDQNELGGLSIIKTWGLVSLDSHVAACITLHPGDMAEYTISSQERATIIFNTHRANNPNPKNEYFSWEADLVTEDCKKSQSKIINSIIEFERQGNFELNELSNRLIYAGSIAASLIWDSERPRRLLAAELALRRLERSAEIKLTLELEALHLLQAPDLGVEEGGAAIKRATASRSKGELSLRPAQRLFDICPFCSRAIAWESLKEASCLGGHHFLRCNLTFLVIKAPGISKYCERCSRPFLNEHIFAPDFPITTTSGSNGSSSFPPIEELTDINIFDDDMRRISGNGASLDPEAIKMKPQSLAAMQFSRYDTCPYCRGKFVN